MRINKYISRSGYSSRKKADEFIKKGVVSVNGEICKDFNKEIKNSDKVFVEGNLLKIEPELIYIFYKPKGCLTAKSDPKGRKLIYDYLPKSLHKLQPIGRLDYNSEGLLLLTNSGELKRKFELPQNNFSRVYRVRYRGNLNQDKINKILSGVTISGIDYQINNIKKITASNLKAEQDHKNKWAEITLKEGKNREIRKIFANFNLEISKLVRISYGRYKLKNMQVADFFKISDEI